MHERSPWVLSHIRNGHKIRSWQVPSIKEQKVLVRRAGSSDALVRRTRWFVGRAGSSDALVRRTRWFVGRAHSVNSMPFERNQKRAWRTNQITLTCKHRVSEILARDKRIFADYFTCRWPRLETWVPQQRFSSNPSIVITLMGPVRFSGKPLVFTWQKNNTGLY